MPVTATGPDPGIREQMRRIRMAAFLLIAGPKHTKCASVELVS